ncbi:MAG: NAD(P)H-hydrate dehydratase, partial [Gammaproteobacteria bacterium]
AIEAAAAAQLPAGTLMQRAGQAAAAAARAMRAGAGGPVLVLAGPGNNGGDALEAAAELAAAGVEVAVIHLEGGARSPEGAAALARARASRARFIDDLADASGWTVAIDGLFGIGLQRPLDGRARHLVEALNRSGRPVLALDVPTGLDADTGAVIGADGVAVQATRTLTFIGDKPGLHTGAGRDHAGAIDVADLGIDAALLPEPEARLAELALFRRCLQARPHASHKGTFGDVAIVGGAQGMLGAAMLAARSALYAGAGRVFAATLDAAPPYDPVHPEIMVRAASGFKAARAVLVLGPGMGDSAQAMRVLAEGLQSDAAVVADADALNLISASVDLQQRLAARARNSILTPHPLEAARLLGVTAAVIQHDRLAAARELAARFDSIVVLKGSGTIVAHPDGRLTINPTGNPALATGGTGDVLAGLTGSLLAQGWPVWEAAVGAVWLHGAAADRLVGSGVGPIGMTAGELPAAVRSLMNYIVSNGSYAETV